MDLDTLTMVSIVIHMTIFIASLVFSWFRRRRALFIFASYFAITAMALLLIDLHATVNPWLGVVAANFLFVLSYLLLFSGVRDFFGDFKIWPLVFWGYLGLVLSVYVFLTIYNYYFLVRTFARFVLSIGVLIQIHRYLRPHYPSMAPVSGSTLKILTGSPNWLMARVSVSSSSGQTKPCIRRSSKGVTGLWLQVADALIP